MEEIQQINYLNETKLQQHDSKHELLSSMDVSHSVWYHIYL